MIFEVKKVRKFAFLEEFWKWSEKHSFGRMGADLLPETCLVCYKENIPVYCIWLWKTDSATQIATYVMANPENKDRKGGLDYLLTEMIVFAKEDDVKMIFFPTSSPIVAKKLLTLGFKEGDVGFGQYFGII